jgi:pimeloyl-ACP methyl ester carboxylesterase
LRLRGVVSLAGITDMRKFGPRCGGAAAKLLGGSFDEVPDRYAQTSPVELLPARVPQRLIHGAADRVVPVELGREYEAAAKKIGGDVELTVIEGAGHFELIAPQSSAWPAVKAAVLSLTQGDSPRRASQHKR